LLHPNPPTTMRLSTLFVVSALCLSLLSAPTSVAARRESRGVRSITRELKDSLQSIEADLIELEDLSYDQPDVEAEIDTPELAEVVENGAGLAYADAFNWQQANQQSGVCRITPAQIEGPFYPGRASFQAISDLTNGGKAKGKQINLNGQVVDRRCNPIAGALVELWQAAASGKYNHRNDPNKAPLDPSFKYWGKAVTDAQGNWHFKTVVPGAYPASGDWWRPAHIHFKVANTGVPELTTQMYFLHDKYNEKDHILRALSAEERNTVVVDATSGTGNFRITINK